MIGKSDGWIGGVILGSVEDIFPAQLALGGGESENGH
jgi:hypothetical protein